MNQTITTKRARKLGYQLARKCDWKGKALCKAFLEALTDANYHHLRTAVAKAINKEVLWKMRLQG